MSQKIADREKQALAQTYKRAPIVWQSGRGVYLYDDQGTEYLDMAAGIAVNALGYNHPALQKALSEPGLIHTSNLYYTLPQIELAEKLREGSFADKVFLCNSGTEANEGALKFARKYAGERRQIVAFSEGFHGRTAGALACTANPRYRDPFEPLMGGVRFATFNELDTVKLDEQTAAVLVEPIQGEGGVRPATPEFLQGLRQLCDRHDVLLIFDEVQCGLGRTGQLWAYQNYGVVPDLLTAAKPLGGGLPIGAVLMQAKVADALEFGDHGTTFGGGPLVTRVAKTVLDVVSPPAFLAGVTERGQQLQAILERVVAEFPLALRAQGRGLMWGLVLDEKLPVARLVEAGYAQRLVMLSSGGNTLRLLPPLIVEPQHLEEFEGGLKTALREVSLALA